MLVKHGSRECLLPDEWWSEAGMGGYRPLRAAFRAKASKLPVFEVQTADVAPCWRELSHGVFNDNSHEGTARERVVRILRAFRDDIALPPIELVRSTPGSGFRFELHHDTHRFYCAVAAGFTCIPATDVTDELAKI
jgi:hypothetical protein